MLYILSSTLNTLLFGQAPPKSYQNFHLDPISLLMEGSGLLKPVSGSAKKPGSIWIRNTALWARAFVHFAHSWKLKRTPLDSPSVKTQKTSFTVREANCSKKEMLKENVHFFMTRWQLLVKAYCSPPLTKALELPQDFSCLLYLKPFPKNISSWFV